MSRNRKDAENRAISPVLIVHQSSQVNDQLQGSLKALGYGKISAVESHSNAINRINSRSLSQQYDFVIFDAQPTDMQSREFVQVVLSFEQGIVLIAASAQPHIDDVFGLLSLGARGFLALPFNTETLETVVMHALSGPPFSDSVLKAPDRNAALSAVVLNNLYKLSVAMRQSREFSTAKGLVQHYRQELHGSMELARLFCQDADHERLLNVLCEQCLDRSRRAATRLGRTREKLERRRKKSVGKSS